MEMQGKGRKFSSELPGWARVLHILLIIVFSSLFLASLWLTAYGFYTGDGSFIAIGIIFTLGFGWLSRLGFTNFSMYERWAFNVELTHSGYFVQIENKRTKETSKQLIKYNQIEEVVISKIQTPVQRTTNEPIYKAKYIIGATVVMVWRDETAKKHIKKFTHSEQDDLNEWLNVFNHHNIPISVTNIDLRNVKEERLLSSLETINKINYKWDGQFEKMIRLGSITKDQPLRMDEHFKRVHSFKISIKYIALLTVLINALYMVHIIKVQSFEIIAELPFHINTAIIVLYMYFMNKLTMLKVLKYIGALTVYMWLGLALLSWMKLITFQFTDHLFFMIFTIFVESLIVFPFIRILRDVWKAEYHDEFQEYNHRLEDEMAK